MDPGGLFNEYCYAMKCKQKLACECSAATASIRQDIQQYREILLSELDARDVDRILMSGSNFCIKRNVCVSVRTITPEVLHAAWEQAFHWDSISALAANGVPFDGALLKAFLAQARRQVSSYKTYADIVERGSKGDKTRCRVDDETCPNPADREVNDSVLSDHIRGIARALIDAKAELQRKSLGFKQQKQAHHNACRAMENDVKTALQNEDSGSLKVHIRPSIRVQSDTSIVGETVYLRKKVKSVKPKLTLKVLERIIQSALQAQYRGLHVRSADEMPAPMSSNDALMPHIMRYQQEQAKELENLCVDKAPVQSQVKQNS